MITNYLGELLSNYTISCAGFVFYVHFLDFVITTLLNNVTIGNIGFVINVYFLAFV